MSMYEQPRLKNSDVFFIDRVNFNNLQSKNINLDTIGKLVKGQENRDVFSDLTKTFIVALNETLSGALFDYTLWNNLQDYIIRHSVTDRDSQYVKDACISLLKNEGSDGDCIVVSEGGIQNTKKYYEIVPILDNNSNDMLVVVSDGFFDTVTKTKEELLNFFLDCLSFQNKFNSNIEFLLRKYINLRINEGSFDLVKLRLS